MLGHIYEAFTLHKETNYSDKVSRAHSHAHSFIGLLEGTLYITEHHQKGPLALRTSTNHFKFKRRLVSHLFL